MFLTAPDLNFPERDHKSENETSHRFSPSIVHPRLQLINVYQIYPRFERNASCRSQRSNKFVPVCLSTDNMIHRSR